MDEPQSLFVATGVSDAISQAAQSQSILIVCIQGHMEDDEKIDTQIWQNAQIHSLLKNCICLRLWDDSEDAKQFKEYYKVTQTPTTYFFGLKQTTLLVLEGNVDFEQFSEKFATVQELFTKQVNDVRQIMQLLLLQQLQNSQAQNAQVPAQQTTNIPATPNTTTNNTNTSNNSLRTNNTTKANTNPIKSASPSNKSTASTNSTSTNKSNTPAAPKTNSNSNNNNNATTPKNIKLPTTTTSPVASKPVERHVTTLAFRLTNGHVIKAQFSPTDSLNTAIEYIDKNRTDGRHKYVLMTVYPKKVFNAEDNDKTLSQLDLVPSGTLVLVATDPTTKPLPHPETSTETSTPSQPLSSPSSSSSSNNSGGMLSGISNYVWGFFGSNTPNTTNPPPTAQAGQNNNKSFWEFTYDSKKEEAIRGNDNTTTKKDPESSNVGIRNRKGVHQLNDKKDDDDKTKYWNGNSTQFQ